MNNNFENQNEFMSDRRFPNNNHQPLNNNNDNVHLKDAYSNTNINKHNITLIESCKKLSIVYIVLWSILIVFIICASPFINFYYWGNASLVAFLLLVTVGSLIGFALFILGVILIYKTLFLRRFYSDNISKSLFIWFWIGLYLFGIFSFVGSFLTIHVCSKIKNLNFKDLETINKSEYSNTSVKNKQNNLFLLKACTWTSFFYILLWSSLIIFIIVVVTTITPIRDMSGYYDYYINMFNTLGIGCGCFGIVLFILGVFLAGINISLSNYFYPKGSALCIVFIIATFFCGIPSFFGSMIAISECNLIKKQYFSKQSINNKQIVNDNLKKDIKMKKSLKISFAVFGSVAAIIGAGLVGGTYSSYSNYQLLSSMQNTVSRDDQLLSLGYNLTDDNANYLDSLLYNYSFGEYVDGYSTTSADGLNGFFNSYNTILGWITNSEKNGIVDYLTNELNTSSTSDSSSDSSSSSDDTSSLISQTISDFNNLESQISNGFPNSSAIENDLRSIINNYLWYYSTNNDDIAQNLSNALDAYNNETSGLLTTISKIDSDLEQLINNKTIDLSSTSSMDSTTKQYFLNYINLLGTNSAKAVNVNPSCFVAMFNTANAITAFDNNDAIGLNDLNNYLQTGSSQTFFDSIFTLYQFAKNSFADSYIGFSMDQISPKGWNKNIANLSDFQKTNLNNILQSQKNVFYQTYPTWDGTWKNEANSANLSDDEAYDIYYLQDSIYHLNCNYNADQSGVIAGSVLLSVGLVIFIVFLSLALKKTKVVEVNLEDSQPIK